jgi:hypothetical protein
MLKIQEFILAHDNWRELLADAPYNLKISEDDGFVLFKYSQIDSDFNEEICREARGLILDARDDFKVVRYAFKKFFNIDESYAAHIDWDTAVASEKIDGSIMSVWFARGKWHISTNGKIDAFKAELNGVGPYKTFGDLFESVLPLSAFVGNRYEPYCLTFELVSPYNKVVIDYPETKVYLLSARNMLSEDLHETPAARQIAKELGVSCPKTYLLEDEAEYRQLVANMPEGHEGIVVCDKNYERVKIKTLLYFQMHKAKNNGVITLERIVDLIRENDDAEFLSYFPEYEDTFTKVRLQLEAIDILVYEIKRVVSLWKKEHPFGEGDRTARKWFAQDFGKNKAAALYFAAFDGRLDSLFTDMTTSKFISLFKIELPKED